MKKDEGFTMEVCQNKGEIKKNQVYEGFREEN